MTRRPPLILSVIAAVLLLASVSALALGEAQRLSPPEQQATIDAAIDSLFTETAGAAVQIDLMGTIDTLFMRDLTATAQFGATVEAGLMATLTATNQPSPTGTPSASPTILTGFEATAVVKTATAAALPPTPAPLVGEPNATTRVRAIVHALPDNASPDFADIPRGEGVIVIGRSADSRFFYVQTLGGVTGWLDVAVVIYTGEIDALAEIDPQAPVLPGELPTLPTLPPTPTPRPTLTSAPPLEAGSAATATVAVSLADVRAEPNITGALVAEVRRGDVLIVLGRTADSGYLFVQTGAGSQGWIGRPLVAYDGSINILPILSSEVLESAPTLVPTSTAAPAADADVLTGTVTASAVNVRSAPRLGAEAVARLRSGEQVTVLGATPTRDYLYVRTPDGLEGWVAVSFINFAAAITDLPVIVPE
jgi:hypothetical protein